MTSAQTVLSWREEWGYQVVDGPVAGFLRVAAGFGRLGVRTHTHTHLPALSPPSGYLLRAPFGFKANYLNTTGSRSRRENPRNSDRSPETSTRHGLPGPPLEKGETQVAASLYALHRSAQVSNQVN